MNKRMLISAVVLAGLLAGQAAQASRIQAAAEIAQWRKGVGQLACTNCLHCS